MPERLVSAEAVETNFNHGDDLSRGECNSWSLPHLYSVPLYVRDATKTKSGQMFFVRSTFTLVVHAK